MTAIDGGRGWSPAGPDGGVGGLGEAVRAAGHWLGAAASVGLVVGIGYWGWQTVTREAHGVPIVRALAGEMRVAPEASGGAVVSDQGLSVGAVQEGRGTARAPEAVTLAPTGTDIAVEDRIAPASRVADADGPALDGPALDGSALDGPAMGGSGADVETTSSETFEVPVIVSGDPVSASLPGVSASPRPSGRPPIIAALGLALRGTDASAASPVGALPPPAGEVAARPLP